MFLINQSKTSSINGVLVFIVVLGTAAKLLLLNHLGIKIFGDFIGYSAYADFLSGAPRDNSTWLDITTFRQPGYPLLIVAARAISVEHQNFILVSINIAATTTACYLVYLTFRKLGYARIFAAMACLVVNLSEFLVWELTPLPSSLAAAFYIGVASYTLQILHRQVLPSKGSFLLIGVLTGCVTLLSEWALIFAVVNIVVLLLFCLPKGGAALRIVGLSLGPGVLILACMFSWNFSRTGQLFLTTGWITAGLHPVVVAADRGLFVLDSANRMDMRIVIEFQQEKPNTFRHTLAILNEMHSESPVSSIERARDMQGYYKDAFLRQPGAMAANSLRNLEEGIESLFRPAFSRAHWYNWPPGSEVFPWVARAEQLFRDARVFDLMGVAIAISSMAVLPLVTLISMLRGKGDKIYNRIVLASSVFSVMPFLMFAPIHMETRYVICTIPFVLVNFFLLLRFLWIGIAKNSQGHEDPGSKVSVLRPPLHF